MQAPFRKEWLRALSPRLPGVLIKPILAQIEPTAYGMLVAAAKEGRTLRG